MRQFSKQLTMSITMINFYQLHLLTPLKMIMGHRIPGTFKPEPDVVGGSGLGEGAMGGQAVKSFVPEK